MHQLLARWDGSRGGWMTCSQRAYEGLIPQPLGSFPASSTNQFVMIDAAGWQTMSMMLQTLSWTFKVCFLLRFFAWSESLMFFTGFKASLSKGKLGKISVFFFPSISTTSRFKYLERLLLLHGRWNYRRACMFTLFTSLGVLGQGAAFDGNRRVKIDGTDPIHWVI